MDYEDMLDRAVEQTPEIEEGGSRFEVADPNVRQEGTRRSWRTTRTSSTGWTATRMRS